MTEIKKLTKIALLAYGIVSLLFGFMIIFLLDDFIGLLSPGWINPLHPRMFGGVLLVITFYTFLVVFKKDWDWEHVKSAYIVLYSLILSTIIMEVSVTAVYFSTLSAAFVSEMIFEVIMMSALLVLGIYAYMKQGG